MTDPPKLPPIFEQNPELRLVGTGVTKLGTPYLKFTSTHPAQVAQVICYVHCRTTEPITYAYSVRRGQLIEEFLGPHGDPNKDVCTPLAVINREF